jgi:hypothetical protein
MIVFQFNLYFYDLMTNNVHTGISFWAHALNTSFTPIYRRP